MARGCCNPGSKPGWDNAPSSHSTIGTHRGPLTIETVTWSTRKPPCLLLHKKKAQIHNDISTVVNHSYRQTWKSQKDIKWKKQSFHALESSRCSCVGSAIVLPITDSISWCKHDKEQFQHASHTPDSVFRPLMSRRGICTVTT